MAQITDLKPELLWKHFARLCSIPRVSKHEEAAVQYVLQTAERLHLPAKVDNAGNVLVSKDGVAEKHNVPGLVLQSHLDMVPQKNDGTAHDFLTDPIRPIVDGEWVRADGTTLGADNGIGAACMLAVLESSSIKHGPIEALFTVDEETGMSGAMGLSKDFIRGRKLINLDSEDEGQIFIGCAGGVEASAELIYPQEKVAADRSAFTLAVRGLRGGHSGIDINLGRANAIKLLNRILFESIEKFDIRICGFTGGNVRNAIPREAFATVVIPSVYKEGFLSFIKELENSIKDEYCVADPGLRVEISETKVPQEVMTAGGQDNLVRAIYACPNGVIRMSDKIPGVVETSSNLAILNCSEGKSEIQCLLRSSVGSARDDLGNAVLSALSLAEAHVEFSGAYPGWVPEPSSEILAHMQSVFQNLFDSKAEIKVVHAGLECGIIGAKYPGMDMVSCGPTIVHPHSPDERVNIGSVKRFWDYLTGVLQEW